MTACIGWPTVTVHPSRHPARLTDELVRALKSRKLPAKLHYLTPRQARRWLSVHTAHAPSGGGAAETTAAYRQVFRNLARYLCGRSVQIVSLGCGAGQKDAQLAGELQRETCALRYLAVDAGQTFVLMAADAVTGATPACKVRRLVADLDELNEWRGFVEQGGDPGEVQLFCAFGITPNTEPGRLIEWLADQAAHGDHLLISANLYDPDDSGNCLPAILPQYDNPETRRWLTTFFDDLDWPVIPEQLEFHLLHQASPARISATLTLSQTQVIRVGVTTVEVPRGACLDVFFSNRFRTADLTGMLERNGFGHADVSETACAAEAVWYAQRL